MRPSSPISWQAMISNPILSPRSHLSTIATIDNPIIKKVRHNEKESFLTMDGIGTSWSKQLGPNTFLHIIGYEQTQMELQ